MFKPTEHKALWQLAGPIMISNISVALLSMVDTAVIGHLDQPYYLGGVTLAMVIFNFLYWGLSFLRMGTTGIIAQHYGAGRNNHLRSSLAHAIILALLIGFLVLTTQTIIIDFALDVLNGSGEVKYYARAYFTVAIWAVPAVLLNLVVTGWMLGMHRPKITLMLAVFVNLLNIILDLIFVLVLEWNVQGVALATVIAQYSGLFLALSINHTILKNYPGRWMKALLTETKSIADMLKVNQNLFLRTLCLLFVFAFFTHQGAAQGDTILAANAILKNFYILLALSLDGFATAAEVMVGKTVGEKNPHRFWHAIKISMFWSVLFSIVFTLFFLLFGSWMINLMTSIEPVQDTANQYLYWLFVIPLVSVWCFVWDGVFIGARKAKEMRNSMLISTALVFLPVWYLTQAYGNNGLWLAFVVFLLFRSISMGWYAWKLERSGAFIISAS